MPAGVPDGAPFPAAAGCVDGLRAACGAAPLAAGLDESPPCARVGMEAQRGEGFVSARSRRSMRVSLVLGTRRWRTSFFLTLWSMLPASKNCAGGAESSCAGMKGTLSMGGVGPLPRCQVKETLCMRCK